MLYIIVRFVRSIYSDDVILETEQKWLLSSRWLVQPVRNTRVSVDIMRPKENIFLFVPNVIGYVRVVLTLLSCYYMPHDHVTASLCYITGSALDAADGYAARLFHQGSKFGAVLDMVTDRFATCLLLVMLSVLYPHFLFVFQVIIALDIVSHWMQMYSSLSRSQTSHKVDPTFSIVMAIYYRRPVLFAFCAGNELFFAMLYLVYYTPGPTVPLLFWSVGLWHLLLAISLPVALGKNLINVIQLVEAAQAITALDVKEREKTHPAK